jgi:site-specific recombinase XerD
VLLATFYNTGARVSEAIAITVGDVHLGATPTVHLHGKGRKERTVPLWKTTATHLRAWLPRIDERPQAPLFPNRRGTSLTRWGVETRLRRAVRAAASGCPTLRGRRISPHTLRHTTAMHLLQAGVGQLLMLATTARDSVSRSRVSTASRSPGSTSAARASIL